MNRIILKTMLVVFVVLTLTFCKEESYTLETAQIFTDNMVLQQGAEVPVWGVTKAGKTVEVTFGTHTASAVADEKGKWLAKLPKLSLGEPDSLVVTSGKQRKVFRNVVVGEVWLCSGQSNMEMSVGCTWAKVKDSEKEVSEANYPNIRLFTVDRATSFSPVDTISTKGWLVCTPQTVADFSAVGYFFGREIHKTQNVPVGLIQAAWGGTLAEAWTSAETLKNLKDFAPIMQQIESLPIHKDSLAKRYEQDNQQMYKEMAQADPGIKGDDTLFAAVDLDVSDWITMKIPGMWEQTQIGTFDGAGWFRMTVNVPKSQLGKDLTLSVAPPDDADETWFNGVKVGESKEWKVVRNYKIPAKLVKEGKNIITVRLLDFQGDGGFMGTKDDFKLSSSDGWSVNYAGEALFKLGYNKADVKMVPLMPNNPNIPTVLYNAMLKPLIPYAIKGVVWYQGESNVSKAFLYRSLFSALITDWRKQWQQGDFPFLFVQLANYLQRNTQPMEDSWSELREAQALALKLPNTAMAVTIDIGDGNDIHPANKQDVGLRLAYNARAKVYGEKIPFSGPIYKAMKIEEGKITLEFEHVYEGLKTSDNGKVNGFSIAGEDKKFVWAEVEIIENKLVVSSAKIKNPVAVRYAWSPNPECNLVNSANLPASPFRTDF